MIISKLALFWFSTALLTLASCDNAEEEQEENTELATTTIAIDRVSEYRAFIDQVTTEIEKQQIESSFLLSSGSQYESQFFVEVDEDSSTSEPKTRNMSRPRKCCWFRGESRRKNRII